MKINKKRIIIAVVIVLFIIGIIPKLVRYITTIVDSRASKYVAIVETPQLSTGEENLELSGELKPYLQTEIYSRINGLVSQRLVQLGEHVKKGQLLAIIETPDLDAEAASAKSALISAEKHLLEAKYQYDFSKQTYDRYKKSAVDGAISRQELESRLNNYKTSEMNYLGAKADVEKAKQDLNRLVALQGYKHVVAPFDGIISKYNVDAGANVVAGGSSTSTSLFEIQQIDKFRATIYVPQSYVSSIKNGQTVEVYIPENPQKKYKGYVSQISGSLDSVSRTMEVALIIPNNGDLGLYSGLYVKTDIEINNKPQMVMISPVCLTTFNGPDQYVVQVRDDSTVHFIKVKQGRDFGDKAEILEGLKGNEKLITNITDDLKEGDKVEFKEQEN